MPELELTINGDVHTLDAPVGISLAQLLRERLGFTGTKIACDEGHCGACTVQVDGVPMLFIRHQDSFGALGLALNATNERNGHEPELAQIHELLIAARDLWRTLPEAEDETEARLVARTTSRLIHLADIVAVTTGA